MSISCMSFFLLSFCHLLSKNVFTEDQLQNYSSLEVTIVDDKCYDDVTITHIEFQNVNSSNTVMFSVSVYMTDVTWTTTVQFPLSLCESLMVSEVLL